MSDNPKHVTVRLRVPPALRDKISESAEKYNRSMNADMVARLENSFLNDDDQTSIDELKSQVQYLHGVIKGYDFAIKKISEDFIKQKTDNINSH